MSPKPFTLFNADHLLALAVVLVFAIGIPLTLRVIGDETWNRLLSVSTEPC